MLLELIMSTKRKKYGKGKTFKPKLGSGDNEISFGKNVFRMWYVYINEIDDKKGVYDDWKISKGEKFDTWWNTNKIRLFGLKKTKCEKIDSLKSSDKDDSSIVVRIPINKTRIQLLSEVEVLLNKEFKERGLQKQKVFIPEGKWIPSVNHRFQWEVYQRRLDCFKLSQEINPKTKKKYTHNEIGMELNIHKYSVEKEDKINAGLQSKEYERKNTQRSTVSRYIKQCRDTLKLVKRGEFK